MKYTNWLFGVFLVAASCTAFAGAVEGRKAFMNSDFKKAFIEYSKSAEKGDAESQYWVGHLHQIAMGGMQQDLKKAVMWTKKSADQGYSLAQYTMGEYFEHGFGVPQNIKKAESYYRKAAAQKNMAAQERVKQGFK